jgi:hypothetical protein
MLGNSIQSNLDQNTSNKAYSRVFTLSDLTHDFYFALNGLLGALFIE